MSQKQLVTVFGATGLQGSSVLNSLHANTQKPFALRGITRNPSSDAAKKLTASGIEVVKADGWDKASLIAAFRGSWAVFANTNSDDAVLENPSETRTEVDLGSIIVDAAVEAGVEVFVYSGFTSAKEITGGKLAVEAFDGEFALFPISWRALQLKVYTQTRARYGSTPSPATSSRSSLLQAQGGTLRTRSWRILRRYWGVFLSCRLKMVR